MSEPFLAEIRMVGFNFAPRGWAYCDGQILPINQNQSLYSLLGTTYGGDGRTTFALPDLRSRTPTHTGSSRTLGSRGGAETHTLSLGEMPQHGHARRASADAAASATVPGNALASYDGGYATSGTSDVTLPAGTVGNAGGNAAHNNMQPYLTVGFCIALQGLFPSRN